MNRMYRLEQLYRTSPTGGKLRGSGKLALRLGLILATGILWRMTASPYACFLFWVLTIASFMKYIIRRRVPGRFLMLLGFTSNALVTTLNGGTMPVNGMPATMYPNKYSPVWTWPDNARWTMLGDHHALYYFSVGDILLLTGLLLYVSTKIVYLVKQKRLRGVSTNASAQIAN